MLKFISTHFDLGFFLSYEMFNPTDRFGEMMLKNFADRGIPLVGMDKYPLLEDQRTRYLQAGFKDVEVYTMLKMCVCVYLATTRSWTRQKSCGFRSWSPSTSSRSGTS